MPNPEVMEELEEGDFVDIDEDNLASEVFGQPKKMLRFGVELADAKKDYADAKGNLELVRAEMADLIRRRPIRFKLKKVTEGAVADCVLRQERYQKALRLLNRRKHRVDILEAAVRSLEHRKVALETGAYIVGQIYHSDPKIHKEGRKGMEEEGKRIARSKGRIRRNE